MHPHKPHYDRHAGTAENKAFLHRISRRRIDPPPVRPGVSAADLLDQAFLSYNAGRLREACELFAQRFFDYENLLGTDKFYRTLCRGEAFQQTFGTAEFHNLVGKYLAEREEQTGVKGKSLLASAYRCGVPIFTSSPGDSSIGMNMAALQLEGSKLQIDPLRDVNQSAAVVWDAKAGGGASGVFILGGGAPKNFLLQTEPQIQEVLGLSEAGHDYFLQFTDARPDTGGLSPSTPRPASGVGRDPLEIPTRRQTIPQDPWGVMLERPARRQSRYPV